MGRRSYTDSVIKDEQEKIKLGSEKQKSDDCLLQDTVPSNKVNKCTFSGSSEFSSSVFSLFRNGAH